MEPWSGGPSNLKSAQNRPNSLSLSGEIHYGPQHIVENDVTKHQQEATQPESTKPVELSGLEESRDAEVPDVKVLIFLHVFFISYEHTCCERFL